MAQRLCCVRFSTQQHRERSELARLARMASSQVARGRDTSKVLAEIAKIKSAQLNTAACLANHEAMHVEEEERARECDGSACTQDHFELRA